MLDPIRRRLGELIGAAVALDMLLSDADPSSLTPLDVAQAGFDLADLCGRLESLADRLANAAAPRPETAEVGTADIC